jgi:hypothetical protein
LAWSISWLLRGSRPAGWNRKYGRLTPVTYIYNRPLFRKNGTTHKISILQYKKNRLSINFAICGKWTSWTILIAQIVHLQ